MEEWMTFIYHRVPSQLFGNTLYPLNQLKDIQPGLYAEAVKKYEGREWIVESRITPFDCMWNDVLFFSPVHPNDIRRALNDAQIKHAPLRFFEIPAERLDPERATIMLYRRSRKEERRYERFDPSDLRRFQHLYPDTALDHRRRARETGIIMLFAFIPHILYLGEVNVEGTNIIEV